MTDKWNVYEALKNNSIKISDIEKIDAEEVKEGLIEYLTAKNHTEKLYYR